MAAASVASTTLSTIRQAFACGYIRIRKKLKYLFVLFLVGAIAIGPARAQSVRWLEQGWTAQEREYWHNRNLGQALAPVSWIQSLEAGQSQTLFLDQKNLKRFGVLFDEKSPSNPRGLPIGFAVASRNSPVAGHFGLTCAACHTGQVAYRGTKIRFDGGATNFDISTVLGEFYKSLSITINDKEKWGRFAKRVQNLEQISEQDLREKVSQVLKGNAWAAEASKNAPGTQVDNGPGRADALNRIGNYVFGQRLLVPENYHKTNAPANFPTLWNIWRFNWVHYNGSFTQPMSRNILQVLGNNGTTNFLDAKGAAVKGDDRWKTSVDFFGAAEMEAAFKKLSPPQWPENVMGAVDQAKAKRGKTLFENNCANCHAPRPIRPPGNQRAELAASLIPLSVIGTDPAHATTYNERRYDLSKLTGSSNPISGSDGLKTAIDAIENNAYKKLNLDKEQRDEINGYGRVNEIRAPLAYRARTLDAIWASPPYLHNGSVPNMFELLSPVADRSKQFWTGTYEYDPVKMGYVSNQIDGNYFYFDATIDGNKNIGHEFDDSKADGVIGRKLSVEERFDLIEYLKIIDQDPPKMLRPVSYDWEWQLGE
jgi:hypothetical protein